MVSAVFRGNNSDLMSRYINELTRKMDSIIQDTPISGSFLSDHATVLFNLKGSKSESSAKEVWFRKIKSINLPKYKNYLKAAVSSHYCFLSMPANFLRSSNHIFLIPVVVQMTRNCTSRLHQEMI